MNSGRITHYTEEHHRITARIEAEVLEPAYPGWTNFVSQHSVREIAVAPQSRRLWLATWGGVLSWSPREELLYRRYSSEHGLAGNAVACICVDQVEHPWAGHVEGGLSYFDGQRWRVYDHLQLESIRAVSRAVNSGGIWAAGMDTVYHIPKGDQPPALVAPRRHTAAVEALALLDTGNKLLLGNAWGLFALQMDKEPVPLAQNTIKTCTALTRDRNGDVWVGTPEGVYRLDGETPVGPIAPERTETIGRVLGLAASRDRIWVLTTTGLAQVIDNHWLSVPGVPEPHPALHTIAASPDEAYLWVGTDRLLAYVQSQGQAAPVWNMDWLPAQPEDKLSNVGRCVVQQGFNGRVWVGTAGGLVAFQPNGKWTLHEDGGDVRALNVARSEANSMTPETLWVLAWPRGIGRWANPDWIDFRGPQPTGLPTALAVGRDGHPYLLAGCALWRLASDELKEVTRTVPTTARCLAQTPDGQWWLGATQGVYRLVSGEWELVGEQPGPLQAGVRALAVLHGQLWAATEMGLWMRRGEKWEPYDAVPDDNLWDVRALAPASSNSALWLARQDRVVRYDPATRMQSIQYTRANSGLGSCRVTALAEIDGDLWIVTQAGISHIKLD